ncbi:hypothetical protein [Streptomyces goshikiensis]|uniref:MmyB family transcriptional regulator n=1 Tax=Streptomyces goshikiensis TaxID=1942 RepID=UPI00368BB9BF
MVNATCDTRSCSSLVRSTWSKYGSKRYHHPFAGDLTLGFEAFTPIGEPDQTLGLYTVEPGSPSENALRMLARWTPTNGVEG